MATVITEEVNRPLPTTNTPLDGKKRSSVVNCVAYSFEGKRLRDTTLDEISDVLKEPDTFVWLGLHEPDEPLLRKIQEGSGTAFLLVAHDLSVVRLMSPRVAVMYLGEIVETGPSARVYDAPRHPYSAALISAVPFPDPKRNREARRIILGGDLPSPMNPPSGCRFRTRCPFVMEVCSEAAPPRIDLEGGGYAACHLHTSGPKLEGDSLLGFVASWSAALK